MAARISAGLLVYRLRQGQLEVFLAHPGGPFFASRDYDCWSIPKGEIQGEEDHLAAALREFEEEIGIQIPARSQFLELGTIRQKGGKIVHAWAVAGDWDDSRPIHSNTFKCEWPPESGKMVRFPEVDRAGFFPLAVAKEKIKASQIPLLDRLAERLQSQR